MKRGEVGTELNIGDADVGFIALSQMLEITRLFSRVL